MSNTLLLYLFLKLDVLIFLIAFMGLWVIIGGMCMLVFYAIDRQELSIKGVASCLLGVLFLITACAVPNTKQMVVLYCIPKIATEHNIKNVSKEFKELYPIAKDYLISIAKEKSKGGQAIAKD